MTLNHLHANAHVRYVTHVDAHADARTHRCDGPIKFKALRAKFQEEAALAQATNSRPTIAEKPRHVPPPAGCHCSSSIFRGDLRASGGKRPVSFPRQTTALTGARYGDDDDDDDDDHGIAAAKQKHAGGSLPLDGPIKFKALRAKFQEEAALAQATNSRPTIARSRDTSPRRRAATAAPSSLRGDLRASGGKRPNLKQPTAPPVDTALPSSTLPSTTTTTTTKARKKCLLLPFRTSKSSKGSSTAGAEESAYLSIGRPGARAPAPGELRDEGCPGGGDGHLSSPDVPVPITPPSGDTTSGDSDSRLMSTLERAKKKLTRKHMLLYGKVKSLPSPDDTTTTTTTREKPAYLKSKGGAETGVEANFPVPAPPPPTPTPPPPPPPPPPIRSLPDLAALGPPPAKPRRPPCVDLDVYRLPVPDQQHPAAPGQSAASTPVLDAPDFPDFGFEVPDDDDNDDDPHHRPIDLASLELEALDFVTFDLPPPANPEASYFEAPLECESAEPASFDLQGLHLTLNPNPNSQAEDAVAREPANLPEPLASKSWCGPGLRDTARDTADPPPVLEHGSAAAGRAHPGGSEAYSSTEETERVGHAAPANGIEASSTQQDGYYDACDNVYEDVENINRYLSSQNARKHKEHKGGHKKGGRTSSHLASQSMDRPSPEHAEHKEQKKRERQRLEKERKEQKEKEKRENEMKKKYKVTGAEEPLYHAKVMVACKVQKKHDLPVTSGDTVSIIRTTNCPKGRWLARDSAHKYGYISVMNVELNIKEMLELGKKAQAAGRGGNADPDTVSIESRSSNYPALTSSFTDDSEEWACDDEPSLCTEGHGKTCVYIDVTRHEALQKLAIFFQHRKDDIGDEAGSDGVTPTKYVTVKHVDQEVDFAHLELLPPPPLYADAF
ncbi:hypothetical protein CRUP_024639 [Coryphaenoides rupestris]|nr:hypothetical protein CRUP_024639 [Coryphaenoides rupestris]